MKTPKLVKKLFPRRLWGGPTDGKKLYLTFDDGPIPEVTPWVLEELKEYNAKATFFCIGDNIAKHPEIYKKVISEGHSVGNHTFNHLNGWKTSVEKYLQNTEECRQVMERHSIQKISSEEKGMKNEFFRPPYGRIKSRQAQALEKLGYKIVMWDIISMDYDSNLSAEKCYRRVAYYAKSGSIIVFHDSLKAEKNLRYALPKILKHFSREGYSFNKLK
ncbi:Peptidoglycan/xylan/chitin deacetylase, PgdA/CDA1 family [Salinimicrobium catena]|uniref:Peptidoglycan/xylan/chitin deacetylase, PgdA/CDA1 family n=1 Tax=Salinimicrobium catena TaxID=390640 RepID=A0A1H5HHU1_9FLAO|nr:polysaccharide deacetylase family protein [Salinimicrobium catena]SDK70311.1 Peptidoglycan/xylan/chitin deacetylase, PgdA/CDA1 family [Salinimicrobium catena]SEE27619.1 Peptidoglycan/xylan/chitin deacetylase, PgdA/CDA1 family [Salinimicrobium catena]